MICIFCSVISINDTVRCIYDRLIPNISVHTADFVSNYLTDSFPASLIKIDPCSFDSDYTGEAALYRAVDCSDLEFIVCAKLKAGNSTL